MISFLAGDSSLVGSTHLLSRQRTAQQNQNPDVRTHSADFHFADLTDVVNLRPIHARISTECHQPKQTEGLEKILQQLILEWIDRLAGVRIAKVSVAEACHPFVQRHTRDNGIVEMKRCHRRDPDGVESTENEDIDQPRIVHVCQQVFPIELQVVIETHLEGVIHPDEQCQGAASQDADEIEMIPGADTRVEPRVQRVMCETATVVVTYQAQ